MPPGPQGSGGFIFAWTTQTTGSTGVGRAFSSDLSHFSPAFKKLFGLRPAELAKKA